MSTAVVFAVGGEFGSSATYLSEVATPGRRGFYSSFQYVSIVLGQLCALLTMILLQSLLDETQMSSWGWFLQPLAGALSDRLGRRPVMLGFSIGGVLLTVPILTALALKQAGHESAYFWWVTGCIGLTLIATLLVREPSRNSTLDTASSEAQRRQTSHTLR